MKRPEEVKREFVRQWLHKADDDLAVDHLLEERPDLRFAVGFHSQQAAEKLIKATLVWHQIEFPKTHDLNRLVELVKAASTGLASALREARSLSSYAIDARYPGDLPEPTLDEANRAVAQADQVRRLVLDHLPSEFRAPR